MAAPTRRKGNQPINNISPILEMYYGMIRNLAGFLQKPVQTLTQSSNFSLASKKTITFEVITNCIER